MEAVEFAPGLPMAEVVAAWRGAIKLAAGRWKVSWHDLANVLSERSAEELVKKPWHPWPEDPGGGPSARPRSPAASSTCSDYFGDSD